MQTPLQPTSFALPAGLDSTSSSSASTSSALPPPASILNTASKTGAEQADEEPVTRPSEEESNEAFANLKDERHFEDNKRKARLVMGEPLGATVNENGDTIVAGDELAENEEMLADLPDDAEDLEMTHARLRTLRGLGLERFKKVQRISLRQNLLSSLSYVPIIPEPESEGHSLVATSQTANDEEIDEDSHDDEDAKKKEEDFEHHHLHGEKRADVVWPLAGMAELEELDLYDNRLKSVKGLEGLVALTSLDLSFNLIRSITPFVDESAESPYAFPDLTHLYLIQNKLGKIEGVRHRHKLVYLEFGGNRIRTIEHLPISANLRSLFLGKNKITKIQGLEGLTGLRTLSIQSNRLTKIEGLETLTELEELYLSHNGLTKVEGLEKNTKLTTLDVGNNKIDSVPISELEPLVLLEEFWANDNLIASLPILPVSTHPAFETIYLEGNPVHKQMGTAYRRRLMLEMPQLKQIDATVVRR